MVAVIALLTAFLLAALSKAREQTRRTVCQSNLRQINAAWEAYFLDYKDGFLRGVNIAYNYGGRQGKGSAAFGARKAVPKILNKYLNMPALLRTGAEVFSCPGDEGTRFIRPSALHYYGTSYLPNPLLIGENNFVGPSGDPCQASIGLWKLVNQRLNRLTRSGVGTPSRVLFVGDHCWFDTWDRTIPKDFPEWHQAQSMHNLVFLDGHADFVRISKGIHANSRYSILPFDDLQAAAVNCQSEVPRE